MSNGMPSKPYDEITYPLPNFNGTTVENWEWVCNFIPHYVRDASMIGLKLIHVSKRRLWRSFKNKDAMFQVYDEIPF